MSPAVSRVTRAALPSLAILPKVPNAVPQALVPVASVALCNRSSVDFRTIRSSSSATRAAVAYVSPDSASSAAGRRPTGRLKIAKNGTGLVLPLAIAASKRV